MGPEDEHQPPRGTGPLEVCWRMRRVSGRVYECAIYPSSTWFDVRLTVDEHTLVYSQVATSIERARDVASLWRDTLVRGGGFDPLDPGK